MTPTRPVVPRLACTNLGDIRDSSPYLKQVGDGSKYLRDQARTRGPELRFMGSEPEGRRLRHLPITAASGSFWESCSMIFY